MIRTSGYIISSILLFLLTGNETLFAEIRTARDIIIPEYTLNISFYADFENASIASGDTSQEVADNYRVGTLSASRHSVTPFRISTALTDDHFIPAILDTTLKAGIRFGVNLSRPFMSALDPSALALEVVADMNLGPRYFAIAEAGLARRDLNEPTYHLKEKGIFIRVGADNNFYRHFNDVIAVGARLGFSLYDRAAPFISAEGDYWGDYSGSLSQDTFFKQWAEVVFVLKTEIFRNVYLGWNLRGKVLMFGSEDRHMNERYIPGFGVGETGSSLGFDFYIFYRIPVRTINRVQKSK